MGVGAQSVLRLKHFPFPSGLFEVPGLAPESAGQTRFLPLPCNIH